MKNPAWLDRHLPVGRHAIVVGIVVAGTLDLLEAMAFHGVRGVTPVQILQSIAGGWLGRATFQAGVASALLGLFSHYAIIVAMMLAYVFASRRIDGLVRRPWISGFAYGCVLYALMDCIVVPFSAAVEFRRPLTLLDLLNGVFCHTVLVGIPIALSAARARRTTAGADTAVRVSSGMRRGVPILLLALLAASAPTSGRAEQSAAGFVGISRWMNSPPLTLDALRSKLVLIDFWAYSCSNCQRSLPVVQRWHAEYAALGLVVVGVHSPEFAAEELPGNVRQAIRRHGITYAVAMDNDFATWNAWKVKAWPTQILLDRDGRVLLRHVGEGHDDSIEAVIRERLGLPPRAVDAPR